jgi:spore coat protein U-like protein
MNGLDKAAAIAGRRNAARWPGRGLCMLWLMAISNPLLALPTCSVASSPNLSFGSVIALASTPDQTSNSGISFWVNCSADVPRAPSLYSSTTPRVLLSGANSVPLALSTESPGGLELPFAAPGMPLNLLMNGSPRTVILYAKIRSIHFRSLPSGNYSATLSLTLEY